MRDGETLGRDLSSLAALRGQEVSFQAHSATPDLRQAFAQGVAGFMQAYPVFNGIDIDWEVSEMNRLRVGRVVNSKPIVPRGWWR